MIPESTVQGQTLDGQTRDRTNPSGQTLDQDTPKFAHLLRKTLNNYLIIIIYKLICFVDFQSVLGYANYR